MLQKTLLAGALASAFAGTDAAAQRGGGRGGAPAGPTPPPTNAQALPVDRATAPYVRTTPPTDPMIQKIVEEGMKRSQVMTIAQTLLDSVGPRLTGSSDADRAQAYMLATYEKWGIPARIENYGTWNSWKNGGAFAVLLFPRVRALEVTAMGWTPGTKGKWVEGNVVVITENVVIVPFFIADGLHSYEDIPMLLGVPEPELRARLARGEPTWQNPTRHRHKRVWYSRSIGDEPHLPEVILERVREAAGAAGAAGQGR